MQEISSLEKVRKLMPIVIKMPAEMEGLEEKKALAGRIDNLMISLASDNVVVVPLLRSGPLVYQLAKGYIETAFFTKERNLTITFPPEIELLAGEEISALFEDETGIKLQGYRWRAKKQTKLPFNPDENEDLRAAFDWLERQSGKRSSPIRQILSDLKEQTQNLGLVKKVVVVDDMDFEGPTGMIIAPYFLGKVFTGAKLETHFLIGKFLVREMVGASFFSLFNQNSNCDTPQEKARRGFLEQLVKGYTDYEGWLVKITEDNWKEVGRRVADECQTTINPAEELVNVFNFKVENLLKIHQLTSEVLRTYGINLYYQTH